MNCNRVAAVLQRHCSKGLHSLTFGSFHGQTRRLSAKWGHTVVSCLNARFPAYSGLF